ncbi:MULTISPECIES: nodulation protein NolU [Bradyrhizobium]|uniref:nodulation protein NolU n=1 Tax=Bradyrhizobium pachyrhizi TaxID=280333 RepID=UPI0009B7385C
MSASISPTEPNRSSPLASDRLRKFVAAIHPSRFAAGLDPLLSPSTLLRLQQSSRLQPRLAELLLGSEVDVSGSGWNDDLLLGHDPRRAALLAGSIWHARSVLKLVSKRDLSILVEMIGAEAHAFAIRQLSTAVATTPVADPEQLSRHIEHDGHACLGAWLDEAPALDRIRVLLRLPIGTAVDNPAAEHRSVAAPLLSLVVSHLGMEAAAV